MDNPFSWDYLTTTPGSNEVFGPFAMGFLILFGVTFVVALIIYSGGGRRIIPNPVLRRMARRWSSPALAISGIGLFFFLIRVLQINPFNFQMRIWLWLCLLLYVLMVIYFAWDYMRNYGAAKAEYEDRKRQQQYLRPASATAGGRHGAPLASGARPVKRRKR
ncbi:MAG: hypothetical protein ACJ789_17670 [Thermomicrobiales bacterium]